MTHNFIDEKLSDLCAVVFGWKTRAAEEKVLKSELVSRKCPCEPTEPPSSALSGARRTDSQRSLAAEGENRFRIRHFALLQKLTLGALAPPPRIGHPDLS
jgi:hypothetical protein